jgi:large subunit ribosomal protein L10
MSKPIKNLVIETYKRKFDGLTGAVVIECRGVPSSANTALRGELMKQGVRVTVVKNSLAKAAFARTGLEKLGVTLEGPCALVYGESVVEVARNLIEKIKELPQIQLKAAIMDGQMFTGPKEIEALSKYPTKAEAQAQVVSIVLAAAGNLINTITGAGSQIVSIIEAIEKKLEKGETIAAIA